MSGATFYMDWRSVLSALFSRRYLRAAAVAYIEVLFVGWGLSYIGDVFYPNAGLVGALPSLAMIIVSLNSVSLATAILQHKGIEIVEDEDRWNQFSTIRMTIYVITMLAGFGLAMLPVGDAPQILVMVLFACLIWTNGYALVRIPHFTVAYLAGASAEQERATAIYLAAPAIALATPSILLVAVLQASVGAQETYMASFLHPATPVSALVPLVYFPFFSLLSWHVFERLRNKPSMPQA